MIPPSPDLSILEQLGRRPRILYLGMDGVFSLIPLAALLAAGRRVAAVVLPGAETRWASPEVAGADLPLLDSPVRPGLAHEAWKHGIPVLEVQRLTEERAWEAAAALRPDLIVIACFPQILPARWLALPALGCLNLHPSLLPAYRGPAPLFWQLRAGEGVTGVTLHFLDRGIDTGDIVAQAPVVFPPGATQAALESTLAESGARLLLAALDLPVLPRRPQPAPGASYQGFPAQADRGVPATWTATRAFNFVRGANEWAPFWLDLDPPLAVAAAFAVEPEGTLAAPYERAGRTVRVRFATGVVDFLLA